MFYGLGRRLGAAAFVFVAITAPATAQQAEQFFKNETITIIVGAGAGESYDIYARLLASYLPQYLPGHVTFIAKNMPSAGSIAALNDLYNVAPGDGTVIGAVNPGAVMAGLLDPENARYDSRKFNWLGSIARETEVITLWHDAPINNFDEAFRTEVLVGGTGGASSVLPTMLDAIVGTKFKVINGYGGANEVFLAMERGEVTGIGSITITALNNTQSRLLAEHKLKIIAQYGLSKNAKLNNIPTVIEYVKTDEQRQAFELVLARQEIGRVFLAPPDVPNAIVAAYKKAFEETMRDEKFQADLKANRLDLDPQTGESLAGLIANAYMAPAPVVARVRGILGTRFN